MSDELRAEITATISAVRRNGPLVHAITGSVTAPIVADGLLAAGARPMMTGTVAEAPTLVSAADALLVNLGSLGSDAAAAIPPTVERAQAAGIRWVLDPAAIGLAPLRTPLARELVARAPAAVRGNASEVLTLSGADGGGSGPDSTAAPQAAADAAAAIARRHGCVVAVSGPVDLITDGERVIRVASGAGMLTKVTGTGCLLGALTAACLSAVGHEPAGQISAFGAVLAATALLTVASERCTGLGPGSFRTALLDALHEITPDEVATGAELRC